MLVSIQLNSNRPDGIKDFVTNIEETSSCPSDIEVLINIDEQDNDCKIMLESLQATTKLKLRFIQTDIIKCYKDLWKPLNVLLQHTDPNAYFVTNFSDEFRFVTKGWDDIIRKYINYYEDDIFRIRLSRYRFRNYVDPWECVFAPDSMAIYTKKWMDIVGQWCPCLGPDSWQQLVAYYLTTNRKFDHIQYNRDIAEPFIQFIGEGANLGLTGLKMRQRIKDNLDLWFETVSYEMQEKASYAAALLQANILTYSHSSLDHLSHNFIATRKPRAFKNKNIEDISFANNFTTKQLEFSYKGQIFHTINYKLNKIKLFITNNLRKINYPFYAGDGSDAVGKDLISNINAYLRMRKYGAWSHEEHFRKPDFLKNNIILGVTWPIVKILLLAYILLKKSVLHKDSKIVAPIVQRLLPTYLILKNSTSPKIKNKLTSLFQKIPLQRSKLAILDLLESAKKNYIILRFNIKDIKKPNHCRGSLCGLYWPLIKAIKSIKLYSVFILNLPNLIRKTIKNSLSNQLVFLIPDEEHSSRFFLLLKFFGEKIYDNFKIINSLKNEQRCYLPIAVSSLSLLEEENFLTSDFIKKAHQNTNITLLFDLSIEAITFENQTSQILYNFHKILKKYRFDPNRIVLLNANYNSSKYYSEWVKNNFPNFQITVIGYNFYLFEYFTEVSSNNWFQDNYNLNLKELTTIKDKKHFMCLNLRPRWHRKAVLLFLISENLLDKGIVTYFGESFGNSDTSTVDASQIANQKILELENGPKLIKSIPSLNSLSPITFERDDEAIKKDLWQRKPGQVEFLIPELNFLGSFTEPLSYFEIVTETWLTDTNCLYFTEKTIRPILRLNPFIIIGSPHTLKYLQRIGFKTFSPFIDESYDEIESKEQRMSAIFKEIKRLCSLDEKELQKMYQELAPILHHNFNHFTNHIPKIFEKEIQETILSPLKINYDLQHC